MIRHPSYICTGFKLTRTLPTALRVVNNQTTYAYCCHVRTTATRTVYFAAALRSLRPPYIPETSSSRACFGSCCRCVVAWSPYHELLSYVLLYGNKTQHANRPCSTARDLWCSVNQSCVYLSCIVYHCLLLLYQVPSNTYSSRYMYHSRIGSRLA